MDDRINFVVFVNERTKKTFSMERSRITKESIMKLSSVPRPYLIEIESERSINLDSSDGISTLRSDREYQVKAQELMSEISEYVKIIDDSELGHQFRFKKRLLVKGRDVTVFFHNNSYYAIDSMCYHAGGPLNMGDIEA
eukprot:TRINITY_DN451_c0_g1_i1.p1 TRINITY_DN451_c0_g1~~TRINITY_DN451_c0_g1_i1.p1  ORF type:complete len:139 (-),score=10.47 TRINITY_DN451_c0_g1_i1:333-749(-)